MICFYNKCWFPSRPTSVVVLIIVVVGVVVVAAAAVVVVVVKENWLSVSGKTKNHWAGCPAT